MKHALRKQHTNTRHELLDPEEEFMLSKRWTEMGDKTALDRLVTSHIRLSISLANKQRGYGLNMNDLIGAGHVGLMNAAQNFKPELGFRFSTFAMVWIRSSIWEHVIANWSSVGFGDRGQIKRLFFKLRQTKAAMGIVENSDLTPEMVEAIARELDVSIEDVLFMQQRMSGADFSLNATLSSDDDQGSTWQDSLVDTSDSQVDILNRKQEQAENGTKLAKALNRLNPREREIFTARRLLDTPKTLDELSQEHRVSRERIRQIENRAFEKVQMAFLDPQKELVFEDI